MISPFKKNSDKNESGYEPKTESDSEPESKLEE